MCVRTYMHNYNNMCTHNYESRSDVGRLIAMYMYIHMYSRYSIALGIVVTLGLTTLYIYTYTFDVQYGIHFNFVVLNVCFSFR